MNKNNNTNWHAIDSRREIERQWKMYEDAYLIGFIAFVVVGCAVWIAMTRNVAKRKPTIHTITLSQRLDPNRAWLEKLRR